MAVGSVLGNGIAGIQQGLNKMNKASAEVAELSTSQDPASDLTESAVSLLQGKLQVEASAKVLETYNRTVGSIIDLEV